MTRKLERDLVFRLFRLPGPVCEAWLFAFTSGAVAREGSEGVSSAVARVIVVERVIPPGAVFLLFFEKNVGQFFPYFRLNILWKQAEGLRGIVMAVVVEVAGDTEVGFVGNRAFASEGKKAITLGEAIEPFIKTFICYRLVTVSAKGDVAGLTTGERAGRAVDAFAWNPPVWKGVDEGTVGSFLLGDTSEGSLHDSFGKGNFEGVAGIL